MEYKNTIITPKTDFPMKAGLPAREPNMLKRWEEQDLYNALLEKNAGLPPFILHGKEIRPVHSEGDQPWDFFGRNDAKAETPVLWPPHVKS